MSKYHPTAIGRTKPSSPAIWIKENIGFHPGSTLDYGCGRGVDVEHFDIEGYDPNGIFAGYPVRGHYETILCTYVLNVIPTEELRVELLTFQFVLIRASLTGGQIRILFKLL